MAPDIIDHLVPTFVGANFEERRRARVAAVSLVFLIFVTGLSAVLAALVGRHVQTLINAGLSMVCLALLWQLRSGRALKPTSVVLVAVQLGGAIVSAVATDGVVNLMTPWVVVPPLFAYSQLGKRAAWLTAGVLWVATALLYFLESAGTFVPPAGPVLLRLEGDRVLSYAMATVFVLLLAQAVEREVTRAREASETRAQLERIRNRQTQLWRLISGMAHEINNPLAAMSSNLQFASTVVGRCARCHPDMPGAIADTAQSTDRVAALINDLRLVTGLTETPAEKVPLHELARQVADDVGPPVRLEVSPTFIHANTAAVESSLRELVRNVRWAVHDGSTEIQLVVRTDGPSAIVELRDHCPNRQPCEFPVAQFLALHAGGDLSYEQLAEGHCVSLRLPALK